MNYKNNNDVIDSYPILLSNGGCQWYSVLFHIDLDFLNLLLMCSY